MTQLPQKMLEELQRLHYAYRTANDSLQLSHVADIQVSRKRQEK